MKTLTTADVLEVSGGDSTLTMVAYVPTGSNYAVAGLFTQLISGQMPDVAAFIAAMEEPGMTAAFNAVRVESVQFSNFN